MLKNRDSRFAFDRDSQDSLTRAASQAVVSRKKLKSNRMARLSRCLSSQELSHVLIASRESH